MSTHRWSRTPRVLTQEDIANTALIHADDCERVFDLREMHAGCEAEIYCAEPVRWKFSIGGGWAYLCGWHWENLPSADDCECLTCADDMEAERRAFSKQRRIES